MVPDENKSCIGLEYFCFEGDGLWTKPDAELVEQAKHEMDLLGLVPASAVEEGAVVRMPKAYPVYDGAYAEALETVRNFVDGLGNLYLVGRNGMHKYNNQDHSMLTAMMAVENIQGANHDIWSVNDEQEYHEEVTRDEDERKAEIGELAATQPHVPMPLPAADPALVILRSAFARVHRTAMGTAMGAVAGGYLMLATLWLVIQGGPNPGATLELLGQYFIGFTVTVPGAFVGLLYGFLWGFILGWLIGYARNVSIGFYVHMIQRRAEADALRNFLNYI